MNRKIAQFREKREKGDELVFKSDFKDFKKFFSLDHKAYLDGAVPAKYKEMMGLIASMVLRCDDCITYHVDRCLQLGMSKEELYEVFNIALIVGGSIVIPHIQRAFELLEEDKD
ncbi:carboxymuconolactone decarboxylase family protein [bacterium]|nr:carboxymuconolactone decarboxylase family protein [FCB group bacterium]MBL7192207.1 carboxymuconolactone decarboxylase family protein [bacterium]